MFKIDLDKEIEASKIVLNYVCESLDKDVDFQIYIVWKCKILQHYKFLITTSLNDGMYYELTFNGIYNEWYLDAYTKIENKVIKQKEIENFVLRKENDVLKENQILKKIIKKFFEYGTPFVQFTDRKGNLLIGVSDACSTFKLGEFESVNLDKKLREVLENGK